jgi:hypothetical protein
VIGEKLASLNCPSDMTMDQSGFTAFLHTIEQLAVESSSMTDTMLGQGPGGIGDMHIGGVDQVVGRHRLRATSAEGQGGVPVDMAKDDAESLAHATTVAARGVLSLSRGENSDSRGAEYPSLADAGYELVVARLEEVLRRADDIAEAGTTDAGHGDWSRIIADELLLEQLSAQGGQAKRDLDRLETYHEFLREQRGSGRRTLIPLGDMPEVHMTEAQGAEEPTTSDSRLTRGEV